MKMRIHYPTRATGRTINDSTLPRYEEGTFAAWLMHSVTSTVTDLLRYQHRRPVISPDELSDNRGVDGSVLEESVQAEKVGVRQEEMRVLLTLIDQLPTCHRDVLLIVDVQRYTCAEAAQRLELPLSTIIFHLSRARVALRDRLVEVGQVPGWHA